MYNQDQSNFNDYTVIDSQTQSRPLAKTFMSNVFMWMFVALSVSAVMAFLFATNASLMGYLVTETGLSIIGWIVLFAPLAFVMIMSFGLHRLSAPAMVGLFLLYAAVNGISFSFILLVYTSASVIGCFAAAAGMFGVMAILGYTTKQDLTGFGRIMIMGVIGIIIASIINFFLGSSGLDYIISFVGVAVFTGLTAYDVQKLKHIGMGVEQEGVGTVGAKKMAIFGALTLYLDFILLFQFLLRLFGDRRN